MLYGSISVASTPEGGATGEAADAAPAGLSDRLTGGLGAFLFFLFIFFWLEINGDLSVVGKLD
jgi:hypothetical protein